MSDILPFCLSEFTNTYYEQKFIARHNRSPKAIYAKKLHFTSCDLQIIFWEEFSLFKSCIWEIFTPALKIPQKLCNHCRKVCELSVPHYLTKLIGSSDRKVKTEIRRMHDHRLLILWLILSKNNTLGTFITFKRIKRQFCGFFSI